METKFPDAQFGQFMKAEEFQDNEKTVTFKGWERKANVDRVKDGKVVKTWDDCLEFTLKYSYPEWAKDKASRPIIGKDGEPMRNRNYMAEYPQGYSIVYHFDEGQMETGSSPLFERFKQVQPKVGERLVMMRTGKLTQTIWHVCRLADRAKNELKEVSTDEFGASLETPF